MHPRPFPPPRDERLDGDARDTSSDWRARLAIEASGVGIWEWHLRTNVVRWDAQMFRIYGVTPTPDGVVPYRVWSDAVVPEELARQEALLREAIQNPGDHRREFRIRRADTGALRHLESVETVRTGPSGEPEWVIGTNLDITERREREAQLRRNHDTFYHLIQTTPFGLYVVDADFRLRQVSAGARKVFQSVSPLLGRDFAEVLRVLWPEPFATDAIGHFWHTLLTGEPYASPGTVMARADIEEVETYDWRIERVMLPDGRYGVVCHFYDLSERQRWEAALLDKERELRTLADNIPDIVARMDRDLRHVYVNAAVTRATGHPPEYLLGKTNRELWTDWPEVERWEAALRRVVESGEPELISVPFLTPQGESHYEARFIPERDAGGHVQNVLAIIRDVTSTWRAEADLRRAKADAEAASAAKDHFLALLSHELRTPLTAVRFVVALWERRAEQLPPGFQRDLALIRRNVDLECRLIDDMLDLNRIARGKLNLQCAALDLHEEIQHALQTVQGDAASKQITVGFSPAATGARVWGDAGRLQQVLWNLLKNAVKFTPVGGAVNVHTRAAPPGRIVVEVRDTGAGIAHEALERIFHAFEQGGAEVTREFGGLGLGLAVSRALAALHGGTLVAFSEGPGKGSTFTLTLNAHEPEASADDRVGERGAAGAARARTPDAPATRILLVEDHEDTVQVMQRVLSALGHEVHAVRSVSAAREAMRARAIDLLVCDLGLPDGSGHDVMRDLRRVGAAPGIALTGFGMESDVRDALGAGFSAHLTKPVNIEQLEVAIRKVMERRSSPAAAPR